MAQTFRNPDTFLTQHGFTIQGVKQTLRVPDGKETLSRWIPVRNIPTYETYEVDKFDYQLVDVDISATQADHIFYYQDAHQQYRPNAEAKWRDLPWTKVSQPDPHLATEPDWATAQSFLAQRFVNGLPAYSFSRVFEKTATGEWEDITADIVDGNDEALELLTDNPIWNPDLTPVHDRSTLPGQVDEDE